MLYIKPLKIPFSIKENFVRFVPASSKARPKTKSLSGLSVIVTFSPETLSPNLL